MDRLFASLAVPGLGFRKVTSYHNARFAILSSGATPATPANVHRQALAD